MADTELNINSAEEVAYKLTRLIANAESKDEQVFHKPDARTYYLTLFHQCIKARQPSFDMQDILSDT